MGKYYANSIIIPIITPLSIKVLCITAYSEIDWNKLNNYKIT